MFNVEKISVFYDDLQALWDVSFKIKKGEIVVIVGANGAGKTTMLKTISGLLHPRFGSIRFLGEPIEKLPPHRIVSLGISHIPEGRKIFPYMSVKENLELGAYIAKARKKMDETMEWVYQLFPILKERKNQKAGTMSGGERQMLAIGRALMSVPTLLMLDEPSLGLAPKLVLSVFEMVKTIKEEGVTILLVEQNVRQALRLADRAYVLDTGRLVLEGKGSELVEDERVKKAFLGI